MSEETETETSIREDLDAAFEGAEMPADESGSSDATSTPPASGDLSPLEAPPHWTETDRTIFASAPRTIQERWLSREKEIADGFGRRGQEIANYKRQVETWDNLFGKLDADLRRTGMTREAYVQSLLQWNQDFHSNPVEAIRAAAKQLGVDLATLVSGAPQVDPTISKLQEEVGGLRRNLEERTVAEQRALQQQNLDRVQTFAEAKGPDGQLAHPHFDEVAPDIIKLLRAGEQDLEKAYTKALRMNDDVWAKVQADKSKADAAAKTRQRAEQVSRAKRAAVGTDSEASQATKDRSLRDDLAEAFSGWGAN